MAKPARTTERSEHETLGQELAHQASAPGADRETYGDLALTCGRAREQQPRHVDAGQHQDEPDSAHQEEQRFPEVVSNRVEAVRCVEREDPLAKDGLALAGVWCLRGLRLEIRTIERLCLGIRARSTLAPGFSLASSVSELKPTAVRWRSSSIMTSGSMKSGGLPARAPLNDGGVTPTIVKMRSRIVTEAPIADGLPPKRRCQ